MCCVTPDKHESAFMFASRQSTVTPTLGKSRHSLLAEYRYNKKFVMVTPRF